MLARLWRRAEVRVEVRPLSGAPTPAFDSDPQPWPSIAAPTVAQDTGLSLEPLSEVPKRAPKRARIGRLYPERKPRPLIHARALIASIQEQCPELIGAYVPHQDLDKAYEELCHKEGWAPCSWTAIARQLKAMRIEKRTLKRNGERFRAAYRIPRA